MHRVGGASRCPERLGPGMGQDWAPISSCGYSFNFLEIFKTISLKEKRRTTIFLENVQTTLCVALGQGGLRMLPVAPVAYQVNLEPGIGHFREFEPRRVHGLV